MIFKARGQYWFTPDIDDNLQQPEGKRLSALIQRPDRETRDELTSLEFIREYSKHELDEARQARSSTGRSPERPEIGKATMSFRRRQDTGRILRDHVVALRNCQVEETDEKGKTHMRTLATGADLAASTAYGIDRLVDLLCAEVLSDELPEELKKNSEPASSLP